MAYRESWSNQILRDSIQQQNNEKVNKEYREFKENLQHQSTDFQRDVKFIEVAVGTTIIVMIVASTLPISFPWICAIGAIPVITFSAIFIYDKCKKK